MPLQPTSPRPATSRIDLMQVHHPAVTCAIPGTRRPAHMLDNLAAGRGAVPEAAFRESYLASMGV